MRNAKHAMKNEKRKQGCLVPSFTGFALHVFHLSFDSPLPGERMSSCNNANSAVPA
jgi:hypothetical protein